MQLKYSETMMYLQIPKQQEVKLFKGITLCESRENLSTSRKHKWKSFPIPPAKHVQMSEIWQHGGRRGALLTNVPGTVLQMNGFELIRLYGGEFPKVK